MFYMPVTKARVKLLLTAEVDLDPESDLPPEQQLDKILKDLCDNPHQFNKYSTEQSFEGEVFEETP